jgi:hypothetical protein
MELEPKVYSPDWQPADQRRADKLAKEDFTLLANRCEKDGRKINLNK